MINTFGIHWAGIDKIVYFPIFLFFIILVIRNYLKVKDKSLQLYRKSQKSVVFPGFSQIKLKLKTFFLCVAILAIFLAILQPQWGKKEQNLMQEGRDLLILLDVSRSMLAKDLKPNRLEFAKLKIRDLVSKLAVDRVGLVIFSGTAFLQCPLTIDHAAFLTYLKSIDVESIASGTTSIESALQKALDVYTQIPDRKNKLVAIITDGEDFSTNLGNVKTLAASNNIRLFALGVGTPEGAPIPIFDNLGRQAGHQTDESGQIVTTKLNEEKLREITQALNGVYIRATYQDADVDQLVKIVKSFEKEKFADKQFSLFHDQYPWFLGVAWFLLLMDFVL
ncbi:MAG: VWA domain-containing protein [Candidatus Babeliales bacterium]|jgi:Ca-activated chloride channel family protein|nr:MAG: TPR domain protein, BatI aerotolerance operon protein BatB [candidate division TM6 bacterium GW2011_GWF2_36_6]